MPIIITQERKNEFIRLINQANQLNLNKDLYQIEVVSVSEDNFNNTIFLLKQMDSNSNVVNQTEINFSKIDLKPIITSTYFYSVESLGVEDFVTIINNRYKLKLELTDLDNFTIVQVPNPNPDQPQITQVYQYELRINIESTLYKLENSINLTSAVYFDDIEAIKIQIQEALVLLENTLAQVADTQVDITTSATNATTATNAATAALTSETNAHASLVAVQAIQTALNDLLNAGGGTGTIDPQILDSITAIQTNVTNLANQVTSDKNAVAANKTSIDTSLSSVQSLASQVTSDKNTVSGYVTSASNAATAAVSAATDAVGAYDAILIIQTNINGTQLTIASQLDSVQTLAAQVTADKNTVNSQVTTASSSATAASSSATSAANTLSTINTIKSAIDTIQANISSMNTQVTNNATTVQTNTNTVATNLSATQTALAAAQSAAADAAASALAAQGGGGGGQNNTVQTLTYSASITQDVANGTKADLTLTGDTTINLPTNLSAGMSGWLRLIQDATGNRKATFASGWKFENGNVPQLTFSSNYTNFQMTDTAKNELLNSFLGRSPVVANSLLTNGSTSGALYFGLKTAISTFINGLGQGLGSDWSSAVNGVVTLSPSLITVNSAGTVSTVEIQTSTGVVKAVLTPSLTNGNGNIIANNLTFTAANQQCYLSGALKVMPSNGGTLRVNAALQTALANCCRISTAINMAPLAGGNIVIYDGAQPGTPDTAITTQLPFGTFYSPTYNDWNVAANGQVTLTGNKNILTSNRAGTPTWFRWTNGALIMDGSVGGPGSGADMILSSPTIANGATVVMTGFTLSIPNKNSSGGAGVLPAIVMSELTVLNSNPINVNSGNAEDLIEWEAISASKVVARIIKNIN